MPPIRTFSSAPINQNTSPTASAKQGEDAATTQQKPVSAAAAPCPAPATTTSTSPDTNTNAASSRTVNAPPARPGASAFPGPTAAPVPAVPPAPTRTYPPTATSGDASANTDANAIANANTPPAPQPGARPVPFTSSPDNANINSSSSSSSSKNTYTVPPPPKAGEPVQPASYYAPKAQQTPTNTSGAQTGVGTGGVLHNANVPNSTSTPYMSMYQPPLPTPSASGSGFAGNSYNYSSGRSSAGPLYADTNNTDNNGEDSLLGESGQKVLNTAKSWMQSAGTKLAEAEAEVWKMVNSK